MLINAMVAEVRRNKLANLLLSNGEPEVTLAAPDPQLGTWRRARPDFLPHKKQIITARNDWISGSGCRNRHLVRLAKLLQSATVSRVFLPHSFQI